MITTNHDLRLEENGPVGIWKSTVIFESIDEDDRWFSVG